jgi:hypothetical protein
LTTVVIFIHRRADTTRQVFSAIRKYAPTRLYVFADAARIGRDESELVLEARKETENVDWPCEVFRHYETENKGLRLSILEGLDLVFESNNSAIILEDDCLPSDSFFPFAESLLLQHKNSPKVGMISGTNLMGTRATEFPYIFIGHPYIWGWATWSHTWKGFRTSADSRKGFSNSLLAVRGLFSKILFWNLLARESALGTWDISFAKYVHSQKLLCAIPAVNLIENLGFDELASHTGLEKIFVSIPKLELSGFAGERQPVRRDVRSELSISRQMFYRLMASVWREPQVLGKIMKRVFAAR